jgi:NADH-quinone oxidoreductase subunit M
MTGVPILSLLILLPLGGAVLLALMPRAAEDAIRRAALLFTLIPFAASLLLLQSFESIAAFQFVEQLAWVPAFGVSYKVGLDGISLWLVLLTTFLSPIVVLSCWGDVHKRVKEFFVLFLVLETGMIGALVALDLFLFYVFWELMLIPMYFLIGVWGGQRRVYAALKFVLYTLVGSLPMLVAILYCAFKARSAGGLPSFDFEKLLTVSFTGTEQYWLFLAFALAFAIKVPLFPLHTWLPDAHVEAPTGGSVILAGVLLKMGTYGFLRFAMPLFPAAVPVVAPVIVALAVAGVVYGALVATVQPDLKKLVAYSSVSHLGFVMLGLFALNGPGVTGSLYQMLNHGLSTGALFLLVGMIYERRHTRQIADFGGLWAQMPIFSSMFLIAMLASVGLPGLNGFVGEFLILLGAFQRWPWATVIASSGVVLGALYLLWMFQRVIFGPLDRDENRTLKDLSSRELVVLVPVLALCFLMGVLPTPFLRKMQPSIDKVLARIEAPAATGRVSQR